MKSFRARAFFLTLVVFIATALAVEEINLPMLPADEDEAHRMLDEGALDSAIWAKIEPFYTAPICVPNGDLTILEDLFSSSLPDDLPTTPAVLDKYRPWDAEAQQKFFSDYPALLPFRPILSFEDNGSIAVPGHMGFCFSRYGTSDAARQYALFSIGDRRQAGLHASLDGRVDFTDSYGRFRRRILNVSPSRSWNFALGNFSPDPGDRFFSGYFPSRNAADTGIADNWLYGSSNAWNGVKIGLSGKQLLQSGEAFFHAGQTERMGRIQGAAQVSSAITWYGGVSFLTTLDSTGQGKDFHYVNTGIELAPAPGWKCELQCGYSIGQGRQGVPLYFAWSHGNDSTGFKGSLTSLPSGFHAPRSGIGRILFDKCGMGDTATTNLLNADLSFYRRLNSSSWLFTYAPRLSCIFAGSSLRCLSTVMELSGRSLFDYRLWFSWSPLFQNKGRTESREQAALELSVPLTKSITLDCSNSISARSDSLWSDRLSMRCHFNSLHTLRLSPVVALYRSSSAQWKRTVGMQQSLVLNKNIFSEMNIEQQLPFSTVETMYARGRMSFLF